MWQLLGNWIGKQFPNNWQYCQYAGVLVQKSKNIKQE
jgi:hypothetical protein